MISPELLRRYPFFAWLNDSQLKAIAMITDELTYEKGATFFKEGDPADAAYLLISGEVDLLFSVGDENGSDRKEFLIDEINVGELFGISTFVEPYLFTATSRASQPCNVLCIQGVGLRALCESDQRLAYLLMKQIAKAYAERLRFTRIQLVAARA
jgi:CRP-like cAMP-binding protein